MRTGDTDASPQNGEVLVQRCLAYDATRREKGRDFVHQGLSNLALGLAAHRRCLLQGVMIVRPDNERGHSIEDPVFTAGWSV